MRRVVVIGCSGSGKSTLTRQLAERTGLPAIHLDRHYWRPGWTQPARGDWLAQVATLVAADRWIMDGHYASTLPMRLARADTLIHLDLSMPVCLTRVLRRTLADYGRPRAELPAGCPERFDLEFLRYIWNYRRTHRPRILDLVAGFDGRRLIFTTPRQVEAWLAGIHT